MRKESKQNSSRKTFKYIQSKQDDTESRMSNLGMEISVNKDQFRTLHYDKSQDMMALKTMGESVRNSKGPDFENLFYKTSTELGGSIRTTKAQKEVIVDSIKNCVPNSTR